MTDPQGAGSPVRHTMPIRYQDVHDWVAQTEARGDFTDLQELLVSDMDTLLRERDALGRLRFPTPQDVERAREEARAEVRENLRTYLREAVELAHALAVEDDDLAQLLREASTSAPAVKPAPATRPVVIPFRGRTAGPGQPPASG